MADGEVNNDGHSRPLIRLLAAGRRSVCRPVASACRRVRRRRSSASFASISSENDSGPHARDDSINYSIFAPEETSSGSLKSGKQDANSRFSSLVKQESEPINTVTFPQWMVEVYNDLQSFSKAARRLFLPESSIKSKLPYYREAVTNPGKWVKLDGKFEHLTQQYRKYGHAGRFESSSTVDRKRGNRFDMPEPGMKSIVVAEILLTWFLTTVYV